MKLFTGLVFALLVSAPAAAQSTRDCVYDYTFLTQKECRIYRMNVLKAKSPEERLALQEKANQLMADRAKARGVAENDWRGLTLTPVNAAAH